MRKFLLATMVAVMLIPGLSFAQKAGSLILGLNVGGTSPMGDFKDENYQMAKGSFSLGADLRYTLINNLSIGPFLQYNRFSSDLIDDRGSVSYNFTQIGGLAKLNLLNVQNGKLYVCGGGGIFTPKEHFWSVSSSEDVSAEQGTFFMGGLGLSSDPTSTVVYNLEIRYNTGEADSKFEEYTVTNKFDFISFLIKLEFNSKGKEPATRY
jgi:opacity protein-like surface antigen